uniref:Putative secreted protein n=1 Tax=Anopheles darlingi TaxID=43151 RepID=A0A2M4D650_ANODA
MMPKIPLLAVPRFVRAFHSQMLITSWLGKRKFRFLVDPLQFHHSTRQLDKRYFAAKSKSSASHSRIFCDAIPSISREKPVVIVRYSRQASNYRSDH